MHLQVLGLLLCLTAFGSSAFDRESLSKRSYDLINEKRSVQLKENPVFMDRLLFSQTSFNDLMRYSRASLTQPFTPFEKRVIRLLRKLGLLKSEAEKFLDELENDKELLEKLKKLLDEVDREHESDDFLDDFYELFFSKNKQ
ncbi:uncharacterized protein [Drosophila takahashii]|uniref:uncharacterized protein n=1 Tax=Drosophila takahashii TaxID=29030 RepID=UPI001CF81164|nr:uncharacterized protein LOC108056064 [Drosophila takahashii]